MDRQKSLFGKAGLPGQGNLFPDDGVPDSMVLPSLGSLTSVVGEVTDVEKLTAAAAEFRQLAATCRARNTLGGMIDAAMHEAFAIVLDARRAELIAGAN